MRYFNIFNFELTHFLRSKTKFLSYLFFFAACLYSLNNGFELQSNYLSTINDIKASEKETIQKITDWFESGEFGPKERSWINVTDPYWCIRYTPTYVLKEPSPILPLGIGQSEQYGFYQKLSIWSSPFDSDIVEEISNYERLINGNIDFSFLILFLLPLLLIILTYNINAFEQDYNFENLIKIQSGNKNKWIITRLAFYFVVIFLPINILFFSVAIINDAFDINLLKLILLSNSYISVFFLSFYFIIRKSFGVSSVAFKMITLWLIFCVIVPGSVHQYVNLKYPTNYMTDFLDANRKDTYDVFKFSKEELNERLLAIYPELSKTKHAKDSIINRTIVRNTMSAIVNQLNSDAIKKIEEQNSNKNKLIKQSFWFNPLSYYQNKWNQLTESDYESYKNYRKFIQNEIDQRLKLLVFECWDQKKVNKDSFQQYLKILKSIE